MKLLKPKATLLAFLLGGLSSFALGCVVSIGGSTSAGTEEKCGDALTNSHPEGDQCFCDIGYDWCTSDPSDYDCCKVPSKPPAGCMSEHNKEINGECFCDSGYTWCNPNDANDYSCCESNQGGSTSGSSGGTDSDGSSSAGSTSSSETDGGVCADYEEPSGECTDGQIWCTNTVACGPEGSSRWECVGGVWQKVDPAIDDQDCQLNDFDFSYGCVDLDPQDLIDNKCGSGPGTPCSNSDADYCGDADTLYYCEWGKLSTYSCLQQCQEVGRDMVTFDYGECGEQGGVIACLCCDFDEPGCGGGGSSSSGGGSSTTL
ncbi:MAG: hypothetical protein H6711_01825 [Myxococcales bacterium]|nr:hypothetical protein [Myxococcales bacterium]